MPLLHVNDMTHYFGGLRAVHNYNLNIEPGQVRGLIGPNGAGKSTIFNLITGLHRPTHGAITLDGQNIVGLQPYQIAAMGLGRTFQNLNLWRHMTVLEHVKMARYLDLSLDLIDSTVEVASRPEYKEEALALEVVDGVIHFTNWSRDQAPLRTPPTEEEKRLRDLATLERLLNTRFEDCEKAYRKHKARRGSRD